MNIDFSRKLIKGKIAETIFEQMLREEGKYAIIPFGYEHTVPTLAQYQHLAQARAVMDNIKDAPDFALISEDKTKIFLVEVKYRNHISVSELKICAEKLLERWNPSWLFVASPDGFYCSPCNTISREGIIEELPESWVSLENQGEYLTLLKEFEC